MKIFLSYPMNGKSLSEQLGIRHAMKEALWNQGYAGCDIVHNAYCPIVEGAGKLYYLGQAISKMDGCDAVAFHPEWVMVNGCKVERSVAEIYGLQIIDLDM